MWFDDAAPQDLQTLAAHEVWGGVPATPVRLPGLGRYGRYEFDKRLLLSRCDLTIAEKRELIFLSQHVHKLDHFEFLGLEPMSAEEYANPRTLKRAFFTLSRLCHPDSLRGKDLGPFTQAAQLVYDYASYVYELLTEDEAFRSAYARVTARRDEVFRERLEREREAQRTQARAQEQQAAQPRPPSAEELAEREARKEALRARLAYNQQRRAPQRPSSAAVSSAQRGAPQAQLEGQPADVRAQAARFFQAGVIAEKRKQWVSARGHFKLAAQYAPEVEEYRAALERVSRELNAQRADELWAQALELDALALAQGGGDKALKKWLERVVPMFQESLELKMSPERALDYHTRCVSRARGELSEPWLQRAAEEHPFLLDLKWALVQRFEARGAQDEARAMAQAMLDLDPAEPRAVTWMKRHTR